MESNIEHLRDLIKEKYDALLDEKARIDLVIDDIQKDINQGRTKTPRTELMRQQDIFRAEIKALTKEFISTRDSLSTKIERLEEIKRKREEDIRLGKVSIEYNLENIQKYIDRGNTNEVFLAIESIKNALIIINNKLSE